jgi:hypothetical protein
VAKADVQFRRPALVTHEAQSFETTVVLSSQLLLRRGFAPADGGLGSRGKFK